MLSLSQELYRRTCSINSMQSNYRSLILLYIYTATTSNTGMHTNDGTFQKECHIRHNVCHITTKLYKQMTMLPATIQRRKENEGAGRQMTYNHIHIR